MNLWILLDLRDGQLAKSPDHLNMIKAMHEEPVTDITLNSEAESFPLGSELRQEFLFSCLQFGTVP